ncbi:hypothetical protein B9Q13_03220 [Candidatus Marsarchaeota G2 archaeon ECH_B_SAG-G16]|uniref:Fe/B12 periplasmic-binding domain-containing protein n=1 Tax=Candidatus Marsarchaeota G2 archaeon ECH_B_SAG-G16 TaxID=1978167 RepID=A0A2R6C2B0_9ARCH|nr:MAG: hypothetical protein B9Q13_03220 [Candidatus Marsarchaeota G2 archaeon ECH_B_SAG-G16]
MKRVFCEITSCELVIPEKPERVASLSPAITETLYMLGLGEKVVGVSAFDVHPIEARKKAILGSYSTTNIEKLRSLKPDVVFVTTGYQRQLALTLSKEFAVYALELPATIASIIDSVVKVALVMGVEETGRELAKTLYLKISELVNSLKLKVYVEIDLGGAVTFGAYSYITDGLAIMGAENIFGKDECEWRKPDFQRVLQEDPDAIIYEPKMFRKTTKEQVLEMLKKRGWHSVRAIKEGRVCVSPGPYDLIAHHGPSFILEAMPWIKSELTKAHPQSDTQL